MSLLLLLDGRIEPTACLLFYLVIKVGIIVCNIFTKKHRTWSTVVKALQENQNTSTNAHAKKINIILNIFRWILTVFYPSPYRIPFFKQGRWYFQKLGQGEQFFKKNLGETRKGRGEESKGRIGAGWDIFIFLFSLLAMMVTNTDFRMSSLRNLFLYKVVPGTSKHWPYSYRVTSFLS